MADHRLDAAPDTVHWGYFDAALKPLLSVESGDTVTISTVSGMAGQMPAAGRARVTAAGSFPIPIPAGRPAQCGRLELPAGCPAGRASATFIQLPR